LHAADAAQRGLALNLHVDPEVPELVVTDATLLKQILHNLVSNALKFTDKGLVSVRIVVNAAHLLVEVKDTGRGISLEDQRRVFNSYTQVQQFETRTIRGTGLGLSLARQLASLLGGEIGLSSRVGEGSIFWLTLPLRSMEAAISEGKQ